MRRPRARAALLGLLGLGAALAAFLVLTRPRPIEALPEHRADAANGELIFHAASCGSCHRAAPGTPGVDRALPSGGVPFPTPAGPLLPGNLTPDPETGLGRWSALDFVNAVQRGLSPEGEHYLPAFPYPSYARMRVQDVLDLRAYLMGLPAVRQPVPAEGLTRRMVRRGVGLWKLVGFDPAPFRPDPARSPTWNRGAYLANAPGHCGECHTPRNRLMVVDESRHFAGGPHPRGEGKVPSLRGLLARKRYKDVADLTDALRFGETYGYEDISSGGMGEVQENLGRLPESEVRALAEYLASQD